MRGIFRFPIELYLVNRSGFPGPLRGLVSGLLWDHLELI
jgi:hypothetical protein